MSRAADVAMGLLVTFLAPSVVAAQGFEQVGTRAQGMGGAFVAVADDASATYWNPAGLVTAPLFSTVAESGWADADNEVLKPRPGVPAGTLASLRQRGTLVAFATPPLGGSFYRLSTTAARVLTAGPVPPPEGTSAELSELRTSHVGVTVLQTLVAGLHVGATVKYVHGSASTLDVAPAPSDPIELARQLADSGSSALDVDAGVMADFTKVRLGLTARNLFEPGFAAPAGTELRLARQVRAGVAVLPAEGLTLSMDADITSSPDVTGDRRSLAVGAEQYVWNRRIGMRGGVRVSTLGETRPTLTGGASVALRTGVYVDGFVAVGVGGPTPDGAGVGLRVVY